MANIESSKPSLKAVLLQNGNQLASRIRFPHETYENIKQLLNKLEYSKCGWHICGDFKVVFMLKGLRMVYTKYCFFFMQMGQPSIT